MSFTFAGILLIIIALSVRSRHATKGKVTSMGTPKFAISTTEKIPIAIGKPIWRPIVSFVPPKLRPLGALQ